MAVALASSAALVLFSVCAVSETASAQAPASIAVAPDPAAERASRFLQGVDAYRRGAYAESEALWRSALDPELARAERARICRALGNACLRQERALEAVAWFEAARRAQPRSRDLWANLELARRRAELEPADRGDLSDGLRRLLETLTPGEWELVAAVCIALAAAGGALRSWRGDRAASWLARGAGCAALLALAVLGWQACCAPRDPQLVIEREGVPLRAEPRAELAVIGRADAGELVERVDALPDWVRVRVRGDLLGWAPASAFAALEPPR
jgi:hypothetical protein